MILSSNFQNYVITAAPLYGAAPYTINKKLLIWHPDRLFCLSVPRCPAIYSWYHGFLNTVLTALPVFSCKRLYNNPLKSPL